MELLNLFSHICNQITAAFAPEWAILVQSKAFWYLVTAAFCGALIGIEREHAEKPAGLRTNMLICTGSCLFTLASILAWQHIAGGVSTVDPGRIAAQIVSGVGFLGAGVILKSGLHIIGITTAATIWLVAAIGMVIGLGFPLLGCTTAIASTLALFLVGKIELSAWFSPKRDPETEPDERT